MGKCGCEGEEHLPSISEERSPSGNLQDQETQTSSEEHRRGTLQSEAGDPWGSRRWFLGSVLLWEHEDTICLHNHHYVTLPQATRHVTWRQTERRSRLQEPASLLRPTLKKFAKAWYNASFLSEFLWIVISHKHRLLMLTRIRCVTIRWINEYFKYFTFNF